MGNNNIQISNSNEINNLKNELTKAKKIKNNWTIKINY